MDRLTYLEHMSGKEAAFEARCKRCGLCCGSADDPCVNLVKKEDNTFYCAVYENRFGPQKTVSGASFNCVPIREHILKGTLRPGCAYAGPGKAE